MIVREISARLAKDVTPQSFIFVKRAVPERIYFSLAPESKICDFSFPFFFTVQIFAFEYYMLYIRV